MWYLYVGFTVLHIIDLSQNWNFNPSGQGQLLRISFGGGAAICFLPVTFLFLSYTVTFPKFGHFPRIQYRIGQNNNFRNLKPGSHDMTIFGEWLW